MKFLSLLILIASLQAWSQDASIEAEVDAVEGEVQSQAQPPAQSQTEQTPPEEQQLSETATVDEELKIQSKVLKRKQTETEVSSDRNLDRFPKTEPYFKKPPGPKQGGSIRVEHPSAAKGLLRINKDGSYQYRTPLKEKSKSSSFRFGTMTPPNVKAANAGITFESMYGSNNVFAIDFDYTWQPFRGFGALGLKLGTGFATVSGSGTFKTARPDSSTPQETYNLFIVPLSAFLEYRFEYVRRQWVVPFVSGGGTYYGLAEVRNDGQTPQFAGAPAVGGGGGLLFSISRLDPAGSFNLTQEYGIADMWFVVEARAMQGLSEDTDFTNQSISAGISVDF